jgi:hypothetical protein
MKTILKLVFGPVGQRPLDIVSNSVGPQHEISSQRGCCPQRATPRKVSTMPYLREGTHGGLAMPYRRATSTSTEVGLASTCPATELKQMRF